MAVHYDFLKNTTHCQTIPSLLPGQNGEYPEVTSPVGVVPNLEQWQIVLLIVALGIFTGFIAKSFNWIRRYVYHDKVTQFFSQFATTLHFAFLPFGLWGGNLQENKSMFNANNTNCVEYA